MDKPYVFIATRKRQRIRGKQKDMLSEAIKLAIEKGGFRFTEPIDSRNKTWAISELSNLNGEDGFTTEQVVLMPLFWQALGKALGWKDVFKNKKSMGLMEMCGHPYCPTEGNCKYQKPERSKYAHQYFDLLLTGGDTEKFWKELLNPNDNDQ